MRLRAETVPLTMASVPRMAEVEGHLMESLAGVIVQSQGKRCVLLV